MSAESLPFELKDILEPQYMEDWSRSNDAKNASKLKSLDIVKSTNPFEEDSHPLQSTQDALDSKITSDPFVRCIATLIAELPPTQFVVSLKEQIENLSAVCDQVNSLLVKKVSAQYHDFVTGAARIHEIEQELLSISAFVTTSRKELLDYDSQFVVKCLAVSQLQLRSKRLHDVMSFLKDIKKFFVYDYVGNQFLTSGQFHEAIILLTEALTPLKSDERYEKFTSASYLKQRLQQQFNTSRNKLNDILKEFAWARYSQQWDYKNYQMALKSFCLMPQSQSIGGQMYRHLGEFAFFETHRILQAACGTSDSGNGNDTSRILQTATLAELSEMLPPEAIISSLNQIFGVQYETMTKLCLLLKWHKMQSAVLNYDNFNNQVGESIYTKPQPYAKYYNGSYFSSKLSSSENAYDLQKEIQSKAHRLPSKAAFAKYLLKIGDELENGRQNIGTRLQQILISVLSSLRLEPTLFKSEEAQKLIVLVYVLAESAEHFLSPHGGVFISMVTDKHKLNGVESAVAMPNGETGLVDSPEASRVPSKSPLFSCLETLLAKYIAALHNASLLKIRAQANADSWERLPVFSDTPLFYLQPIEKTLEAEFGKILHSPADCDKASDENAVFPLNYNPFEKDGTAYEELFRPFVLEEKSKNGKSFAFNGSAETLTDGEYRNYYELLDRFSISDEDAFANSALNNYALNYTQSGTRCATTVGLAAIIESHWNLIRLVPHLLSVGLKNIFEIVDLYFYVVLQKMVNLDAFQKLMRQVTLSSESLSGSQLADHYELYLQHNAVHSLRQVLVGFRKAHLEKVQNTTDSGTFDIPNGLTELLSGHSMAKISEPKLYGLVERAVALESLATVVESLEECFLVIRDETLVLKALDVASVAQNIKDGKIGVKTILSQYLSPDEVSQLVFKIHQRWMATNEANDYVFAQVGNTLLNYSVLTNFASMARWDVKYMQTAPTHGKISQCCHTLDEFASKLFLTSAGSIPVHCQIRIWQILHERCVYLAVDMLSSTRRLPINDRAFDQNVLKLFKEDIDQLLDCCHKHLADAHVKTSFTLQNFRSHSPNSVPKSSAKYFEDYWSAHLLPANEAVQWCKAQDTYNVGILSSLLLKYEVRKKVAQGTVAEVEELYSQRLKHFYRTGYRLQA